MNSSSAGATFLSQHATSREDCREEQPKSWFGQVYGAEVGLLLEKLLAHPWGPALLPARIWLKASSLPGMGDWQERHKAREGHVPRHIQPGGSVHAEDSLHLCWHAGLTAPRWGVLCACTNLLCSLFHLPNPSLLLPTLYIHVTPQLRLFFTSSALFYPVHHFLISIFWSLCCAIHLKESA